MAVKTSWSSGDVLTAADLTDTFAAKLDLAGGKVVQVVSAYVSATRSTTSGTYVDITDLTLDITPSAAGSRVVLFANFGLSVNTVKAASLIQIVRNSSVGVGPTVEIFVNATDQIPASIIGVDSPSTTSSVNYKGVFRTSGGTMSLINGMSLVAMELSA